MTSRLLSPSWRERLDSAWGWPLGARPGPAGALLSGLKALHFRTVFQPHPFPKTIHRWEFLGLGDVITPAHEYISTHLLFFVTKKIRRREHKQKRNTPQTNTSSYLSKLFIDERSRFFFQYWLQWCPATWPFTSRMDASSEKARKSAPRN